MLVILICIIFLLISFILYYDRIFKCNGITKVPGYPIIGNLFDMLPHKLLETLEKFQLIYGDLYELYIINKRIIVISDYNLIKELLSKRPKIFRRLRSFDHAAKTFHFSNGLFHATGNTWNHIRRITSPSFSNQNISLQIKIILEESLNTMKLLEQYTNSKEETNLKNHSFHYTLNVITKIALGSTLSIEASNYLFSNEFPNDIKKFFQFALESALFPFPLWLWRISPYYKYELNAIPCNEMLTKYSLEIIKEQRKLINNEHNNTSNTTINNNNNNNNTCMIAEMIRKETIINKNTLHHPILPSQHNQQINNISNHNHNKHQEKGGKEHNDAIANTSDANVIVTSDEDLLANIKTFFLAGSDTTSVTITSALYYLYTHPDIANMVRNEADAFYIKITKENNNTDNSDNNNNIKPIIDINDISITDSMGNNKDLITNYIQNELKLCNAVIKESLRLGSPAPFLGIELEANTTTTSRSINTNNSTTKTTNSSSSKSYRSTYNPNLVIHPTDEVFIYLEGAMKNNNIFNEPNKFDPTRWLLQEEEVGVINNTSTNNTSSTTNNDKKKNDIRPLNLMKESFLAFGYGPRICPGIYLANIEALLFLTTIMHYYNIQITCPLNEIYRELSFVASFNKLPVFLTRR